jgi:hypothetical protein
VRQLSRAQGTDGFDEAITFELAEDILCVLRRPGPRIGDLLHAGCDRLPVDADLDQACLADADQQVRSVLG